MADKVSGGLFLPIEIVKREYTSKLLLACHMACKGVPVYIGHKSPVLKLARKADNPGILFYKAADIFEDLKTSGFKLVAQDEEAGVIFKDFSYFAENRTSILNAGLMDRFFCWGKDDFNYLQKNAKGNRYNIVGSGSPRTILWGDLGRKFFRKEIDEIVSNYGDYILIATNLSAGNSYLGRDGLMKHLSQYSDWTPERLQEFNGNCDEELDQMALFIDAAKLVSERKNINVLIRPHPTEDIDKWKTLVAKIPRVKVESEGDITPWILGAKCLIHNGCTSAIEAHVSGVAAIALGRDESSLTNIPNSVPNQLSLQALSCEELLITMSNLDDLFEQHRSKHRSLVSNKLINPGSLDSLQAISKSLLELYDTDNSYKEELLGSDSLIYDVYEAFRSSIFGKLLIPVMTRQKRPSIKKQAILRDVKHCLDVLGERQTLSIKRVGPSVYRLENKEK